MGILASPPPLFLGGGRLRYVAVPQIHGDSVSNFM